jgi:hypothetical protein
MANRIKFKELIRLVLKASVVWLNFLFNHLVSTQAAEKL